MKRRHFIKLSSFFLALFPFLKPRGEPEYVKLAETEALYIGATIGDGGDYNTIAEAIADLPKNIKGAGFDILSDINDVALKNRITPIKDPNTGKEYYILQGLS